MINDPDNYNEDLNEETEDKTFAQRVEESLAWVVNMMNEGHVDPNDVYPPGRYQGD